MGSSQIQLEIQDLVRLCAGLGWVMGITLGKLWEKLCLGEGIFWV